MGAVGGAGGVDGVGAVGDAGSWCVDDEPPHDMVNIMKAAPANANAVTLPARFDTLMFIPTTLLTRAHAGCLP